ncbi:MAG: uracil-xanthine permease family protein [Ignavibacteriales bacterium]
MDEQRVDVVGYLPDDTPPIGKLIVFALQHVIVMFPATVLVAILTGFDVGVTIVASGVATLGFILVTRRRIPLYYGSSFSYIAAVSGVARVAGVQAAQCGIVGSGLVSILAGWLVKTFGQKVIKRILPPVVTGSVAIVIGIALAFTAMNMASLNWTAALITLMSTILFSAFLKGTLGQLPVLFGVVVGYVASLAMGIVDFKPIQEAAFFAVPKFTLPVWSPSALLAIMPVAIATIPESTAHLYQIDLYVNDVAGKLGRAKKYGIAGLLGENLIGDGVGDMIAGAIGGPAGTNYGENNSLMAITRNFSVPVIMTAAVFAIIMGFFGWIAGVVNSIPTAVIGGVSIYLFGVIGGQGVALMISEKVDLFDPRNLAIAATILVIGIGGSFFTDPAALKAGTLAFTGTIPIWGMQLPAIATASVFGMALNLVFEAFKK